MASDQIRLVLKLVCFIFPWSFKLLLHRVLAVHHRWTYKPVTSPKHVVVIGGSFAGVQVAKRLTETLPTGWQVVLIERNSHFNYLFTFPRFSVVPGHEHKCFIPYDEIMGGAPAGSFRSVQDTVTKITKEHVCLASGQKIEYAYLAIATGSTQLLPAKTIATERGEACAELRSLQDKIKTATRIAVVGGGAVGVEVATDIKSFFPEKDVTLFNSRDRLMPQFGPRLHEAALAASSRLGVVVRLTQRPEILPGETSLHVSDGSTEEFDLVIPCTGQVPNSLILEGLAPEAISKQTQRILVKPTLQIRLPNAAMLPNIFALGDVAETTGPRMARAAYFQADIVVANLLALICGQDPLQAYSPLITVEGSIKLTLGKTDYVLYAPNPDGKDYLISGKGGGEDLDIEKGWRLVGARYSEKLAEGSLED